jgi:peptidoglycan/LPS O-acetylase OafA/YrhL
MKEKSSTVSGGHIAALDGLRGLAILAVLIFHFAPYVAGTNPVLFAVNNWRVSAWCGVDLFFVLSGFLITGILLDAKTSAHYFRNFYARRTLRIFPLYFGVLLAAWALAQVTGTALSESVHDRELADQPFWLWTYCTNIAVALKGNWTLTFHGLSVSHFWSLAVEEHFYLLWPVVVLVLRPRGLAIACCLAIVGAVLLRTVLIAHGAAPLTVYVLTPCRLDALALGGLLALMARQSDLAGYRKHASWLALATGVLMAAIFAIGGGDLLTASFRGQTPLVRAAQVFGATVGYTLLAVCFGSVLVLAVSSPTGWVACGCNSAILRFLGKYSYGLYVYHDALDPLFDRWFPRADIAALVHSITLAGFLVMLFKCSLAIAVAVASWHLFEKSVLRWKKYFEYREASPASLTSNPNAVRGSVVACTLPRIAPGAPEGRG